MMRKAGLLAAVVAVITLVPAVPARAQARIDLGAAAGVVDPLHSDLDFVAFAWLASLRLPISRHVLVDAGVTRWSHTASEVWVNVPIQGPDGIIGTYGRLTQRTERTTTAFGASVLVTGGDKIRISAGGGPGIYMLRRRLDETVTGCEANDPRLCQDHSSTYSDVGIGVQALAEIGFGRARVAPFVQVRFELPDLTDAGSGSVGIWAGARLAL